MSDYILCVDPDDDTLTDTVNHLESELTDLDPTIERAGRMADAEELLTKELGAVITEYDLPDGTGVELLDKAKAIAPDAGCILYTNADPDTIDTDSLQSAVTEYVGKQSVFGNERLARLLRTTVEEKTQTSYPLPQNESERLATLQSYDLDNDDLQNSLERVSDLAADHFDVDIASINIITEHNQEFLSCYGDAQHWTQMDREDSICTFTILEDDNVMTVEDVTEDPRFQSRSDTLTELGIRSYMGANLVTKTGLAIGPLCIYDDEPRSFSAADEAYLRDLATVAMDFIELYTQLEADESDSGETE